MGSKWEQLVELA